MKVKDLSCFGLIFTAFTVLESTKQNKSLISLFLSFFFVFDRLSVV